MGEVSYRRVFKNQSKYVVFDVDTKEKKYFSQAKDACQYLGLKGNRHFRHLIGGRYILKLTEEFVEPSDKEIAALKINAKKGRRNKAE